MTNPVCPIELISLIAQSTPFFRLDQTADMRFVVTRHNNPQIGDPLDFTVFAQARGYQTGQFTYNQMTFVPVIEPLEPAIIEVEPTIQVVTPTVVETDTEVVRSAAVEAEIDWLLTGLIIAVVFCTLCAVFLYCCRDTNKTEPTDSSITQ